jgi:hypothetical protein
MNHETNAFSLANAVRMLERALVYTHSRSDLNRKISG